MIMLYLSLTLSRLLFSIRRMCIRIAYFFLILHDKIKEYQTKRLHRQSILALRSAEIAHMKLTGKPFEGIYEIR